jgi:hypothetical protein
MQQHRFCTQTATIGLLMLYTLLSRMFMLCVKQVRGMSFSRCFRYYKAAKEAHSGPDAFIINGRDRTFNLPFLKSFFTLACNGTTVSEREYTVF